MQKNNLSNTLKEYIPKKAVNGVVELLMKYPIHLKTTKERLTKQGDFKVLKNGQPQITINHNLNKYSFLLTLIHEIAHYTTYKKYRKRVKPHGVEWKNEFKYLMLPFLNNDIFPNDTLPYLAQYLKNPKASTGSDLQLSLALKKYDKQTDKTYLFELSAGDLFQLRNKTFILGNKRRTRFECIEENSNKKYLIHQNAEVNLMKNYK